MHDKKKLVINTFKKAGKPLRTGDIAKSIGLESKEVTKIIQELKKEGKVISPKRCYYDLVKKRQLNKLPFFAQAVTLTVL